MTDRHEFDKDYWDQHWGQTQRGASGATDGDAPHPYLVSGTSGLTPGTALDAGCGAGGEAIWLAAEGWDVTAADISPHALTRAARRASAAGITGRVRWVEAVHVFAGFTLPVAPLAGLVSRTYRDDTRRFNRFTSNDWAWLRSRQRRDRHIAVGKIKDGQKFNASLSAGSIGALLLSGVLMCFTGQARARSRGA